jgi:hypothetical protein
VTEPLPDALAELLTELQAEGFRVARDEYSEQYFGNRFIELADPDHPTIDGIEVVKDRGLWDVQIVLAGAKHNSYDVAQAQR